MKKKNSFIAVLFLAGLFFVGCSTGAGSLKTKGPVVVLPQQTGIQEQSYLEKGPTAAVNAESAGGSIMDTLEQTMRKLTFERERNQQLEGKIAIIEAENKKRTQDIKKLSLQENRLNGWRQKLPSWRKRIASLQRIPAARSLY